MTRLQWTCVGFAALLVVSVGCKSGDDDDDDNAAGTGGASAGTTAAGSGGMGGSGGSTAAGSGGSTAAGSGGSTAAGSGGSMAAGSGGSGAAGMDAGMMDTDSGADSGSDDGGTDSGTDSGSNASAEALMFCADYAEHCTFGGTNRFDDMDDCTTMFDGFVDDRQSCAATHLGNVMAREGMGDYADYQMTHCPHATGIEMCTE